MWANINNPIQTKLKPHGFTIVELLIVIVVIGILAAITIVAYNGVQNRANDTAVQSDLRNLAMKVREVEALTGSIPTGTGATGITGLIDKFPPAKGAYATTSHNFYYCTGVISGNTEFAVAAVSRSGTKFRYSSISGASSYTSAWNNSGDICPGLGFTAGLFTFAYGFDLGAQNWNSWIR